MEDVRRGLGKELFSDDLYTFYENHGSMCKNVVVYNKNKECIYSMSRATEKDAKIEVKKGKHGKHTYYRIDLYADNTKNWQYSMILLPINMFHISPVWNDRDFCDTNRTKIQIKTSGAYIDIQRVNK